MADTDAADEVIALVLDRLTVLNAINQSTRECARPINAGSIQRWHDELHQKLVTFNLKKLNHADNSIFEL